MNVTGLVDTAGTVQERYVYEPYGKVAFYNGSWTSLGSSAKSNSILNTGSPLDAETGLYNKRHRQTYHPGMGTWDQRDFGYIDGANLYQYVKSAPVVMLDPSGLAGAWGPDWGWNSHAPGGYAKAEPTIDLEAQLSDLEKRKNYAWSQDWKVGQDVAWLWEQIQYTKRQLLKENRNYLFLKWRNTYPHAQYGSPMIGGTTVYDKDKTPPGWKLEVFELKMPSWTRVKYVVQRGMINKGSTDTILQEVVTDDWVQMNKFRDYYNRNGGTKWVGQNSREYWIRGRPADLADAASRRGNVRVEATNRLAVILDELLNGLDKVTVKTWVCGNSALYEVQGVSYDAGQKIVDEWISTK